MKTSTQKATSHKEVYAYFVGTGVLDCPKRQKVDTQKAKKTPTDFKICRGIVIYVSFSSIYPQVNGKKSNF